MITIYADVLFMVNFIMTFFVLFCLRLFMRVKKNMLYCLLGGLAAGLGYTFIVLWGKLHFLRNPLGFLGLMIACVYIAYLPKGFKLLLKLTAAAGLMTLLTGGICSGLFYYTNMGIYFGLSHGFQGLPLWVLGVSVCLCYFVIKLILKIYKNSVIKRRELKEVTVGLKGKTVTFNALADTGCSIREPITGKPLIIADIAVLEELFPEGEKLKDIYGYIGEKGEEINFYFALYKSLGNSSAVLPCFEPDCVFIDGEPLNNILIGISLTELKSDGGFDGLINTEITEHKEAEKNAYRAA